MDYGDAYHYVVRAGQRLLRLNDLVAFDFAKTVGADDFRFRALDHQHHRRHVSGHAFIRTFHGQPRRQKIVRHLSFVLGRFRSALRFNIGRAIGGFSPIAIGYLLQYYTIGYAMLYFTALYLISFAVMLTLKRDPSVVDAEEML